MNKKTVLIITDGIGHNDSEKDNAFFSAKKPTYDYFFKNVPYSLIHTYGEHVGLPNMQMGNSEVGHMTIGSGRVLYQDLVKINLAIKDNTLKDNEILKNTIIKSKNIHLVGLASDGGVHSHINHIIEIAKISSNMNKKVFVHIITDGRDVFLDSAKEYLKEIEKICNENIQIATICGRYYAMDRDNKWDRIKKAYDNIVFAKNLIKNTPLDYIENSYKQNVFDEFLEPASFNNYNGVQKEDGVIFCNFRSDRMREITSAFANKQFKEFETFKENLNLATMTQYDKNTPINVIFPKENPKNTLAQVICDANLTQLHTAETEKYAHVTFFFNGGVEDPVLNETRILIPSPNVPTYDVKPEMSAYEVGEVVRKAMKNNIDFIVVNFANGDMVGHTGVFEASVKAVEAVDAEIGKIFEVAKEQNYNIVLTSDHGNCEKMKDEEGNVLTNHTVGDVYCFVYSKKVKFVKNGSLNNIAPTILKLMNLNIPKEMDEPLIE